MEPKTERLIELLLAEGLGDAAVMVYHDEDPADIRTEIREQGYMHGDDDEMAEALLAWAFSGSDYELGMLDSLL